MFGYNQSGERVIKKIIYRYRYVCGPIIDPDPDPGIESMQYFGDSTGSLELDSLSIPEEEEYPEDSTSISEGLGTVTTMSAPSTQYCYGTSVSTRWYHLSFGKVLYETVPGTLAQKTHYIYAGDERIAEIDYNGVVYYYINDHLGTSRVMVRGSDGVAAAKYYRYGAYGKTMSEVVNIVNQPNKYTSKPFDSDLGLNLYYFGARYYDPRTGQWPAVDPMRGKYPGWSPYVYCAGNPMKFIDKDGNSCAEPGAKEDDPNKHKIVGQPTSVGAIVKIYETNVNEMAAKAGQGLAAAGKTVAVASLNATEQVCNTAGPALIVAGTVMVQPEVRAAGHALGAIGSGASILKMVVDPTSTNLANGAAAVATLIASRFGSAAMVNLAKEGKVTMAGARALSANALILEKVGNRGLSITMQDMANSILPQPQQ